MSSKIKVAVTGTLAGILFIIMYGLLRIDLIITFFISIAAYIGLGFLFDAKNNLPKH